MLVFLALNKIDLAYEQTELSDVILKVTSGEYDFPELLQCILNHLGSSPIWMKQKSINRYQKTSLPKSTKIPARRLNNN